MGTISLVTGGNRGIGLEVCRQLAERGHTVLLTARSADAAVAAARATGAEPLQLDVADPASIAAAARQVAGPGLAVRTAQHLPQARHRD